MGNLKSSIAFMKTNNEDNQYDRALVNNKRALKYFINEVPQRIED